MTNTRVTNICSHRKGNNKRTLERIRQWSGMDRLQSASKRVQFSPGPVQTQTSCSLGRQDTGCWPEPHGSIWLSGSRKKRFGSIKVLMASHIEVVGSWGHWKEVKSLMSACRTNACMHAHTKLHNSTHICNTYEYIHACMNTYTHTVPGGMLTNTHTHTHTNK